MKKRYAKLNRGRLRWCTYIKDQLQGEKNSRKGKQRKRCRKNIIGLKKLKLFTREREKKENSPDLQKANVEAEIYNNKKYDWGGGELKSLDFTVPIKSTTTTKGG